VLPNDKLGLHDMYLYTLSTAQELLGSKDYNGNIARSGKMTYLLDCL
jgi:hypothetical protein